MSAREYVWLVEESAYGTPVALPVVGTSQFLVPLIESNSFGMVEDPVFTEIPYGGGFDDPADLIADSHTCKGSLSTLGYPSLTAFLLNAAVTRINAGQTLPYVTTEPVGDLVSFSAYHLILGRDGVWITRVYPGCKILSLAGSVSRQDPKLKLKLQIQAMKELPNAADSSTAPTPPAAPTEAQYPRGPYTFSNTAGLITLGAGALTQYSDLNFTVTNKFDPQWYEQKWLSTLGCKGREATAEMTLLLKSTSDLRSTFQAATSQGFSVEFNTGAHTQVIGFNSNNHINKLAYDLPLGKEFWQKATFKNKWDATALAGVGADLTVSNT